MQTENIPLDETDCFSSFFIDYVRENPELKKFYSQFPTVENFDDAIKSRSFDKAKRKTLVKALQNQYAETSAPGKVTDHIQSLEKDNTFTITTGHQLNIFTGPLYFIYKIVTVINACKSLKAAYPKHNFVPVYWMASEDHDFEEIDHFHFDHKKYQWETNQTGAVGRFDLKGIEKILDRLPAGADFFKEAYSKETLADACRYYVNHLFGEEGIIVIDADDAELKKLFVPVIEDDLFQHTALAATEKDTEAIHSIGYKTQVNCREINFFYLDNGTRERIEKEGDKFRVVNTDLLFSANELKKLIKDSPEKFSPNVILRPLYQETILPNLAYVGGPSEVVYWLQLKTMFERYKTPFPFLMPRNFALVIPKNDAEKWSKTGLSNMDLFLGKDNAFQKWLSNHTAHELSYGDEINQLDALYKKLGAKAESVDPTLLQHLEALGASANSKLDKAQKKLVRAEKRKHQDKQNQINAVIDSLFPNGSLQERHDNFLNFYLKDTNFIQSLLDTFDAFDYSMYLIFE